MMKNESCWDISVQSCLLMYSDVLPYTKCTLATTSPSSFEFLSKINTVFQNHFGHSFFTTKLRIQCFLIWVLKILDNLCMIYDFYTLIYNLFIRNIFVNFPVKARSVLFLYIAFESSLRFVCAVFNLYSTYILYCLNPPMLYIGLLNRLVKHRLAMKPTF